MHAENSFRLDGIHFVEAAVRAGGLVQIRSHRAIGDEDGILEALVEIVDLQIYRFLSIEMRERGPALSVFVP